MTKLADQQCTPIKATDSLLSPQQLEQYLNELDDLWQLDGRAPVIRREFRFNDYHQTIDFVNKVAEIIHQQDHHPEMQVSYNRCMLEFTTHSIQNLSVNDFICAAKINQLKL